ncbi:MAG: DinB family protein [Saprospiraceae bacterium]
MQATFTHLRQTRQNIFKIVESYGLEQLNVIPQGFNNNLIWNFGHVLVTQQLLCYRLAGLEAAFENKVIDAYRKGSSPKEPASETELQNFKNHCFSLLDQLEKDYAAGLFQNYKPYPTSFGVTLNNIEEAIQFNTIHEAMHLGTMIALRKLV